MRSGRIVQTQDMAPTRHLFFSLFLLLPLIHAATSASDDAKCVYSVFIRTGSIIKAGTDSKISLTLSDSSDGAGIYVADLETWGLMEEGYDYYERGNLDIFSGRGRCLDGPICYLNLTSDGTGPHAGWYVEYVEVTATGPHLGCSQSLFYVRQWLAVDAYPYRLFSIIDGCGGGGGNGNGTTASTRKSVFYGDGARAMDS